MADRLNNLGRVEDGFKPSVTLDKGYFQLVNGHKVTMTWAVNRPSDVERQAIDAGKLDKKRITPKMTKVTVDLVGINKEFFLEMFGKGYRVHVAPHVKKWDDATAERYSRETISWKEFEAKAGGGFATIKANAVRQGAISTLTVLIKSLKESGMNRAGCHAACMPAAEAQGIESGVLDRILDEHFPPETKN